MPVLADVMTRGVFAVERGLGLRGAARRMVERGVGAALVLDGERLVGILTEREVLVAVASDRGMFAVTYSTQAILPQLGRSFGVSPAQAGLTISVVVLALACGAWIWGPLSDRYGRKRSIVLACALLVPPTLGAALAPSFALLLAFRALHGLCMPGLLTAGVPD